MKNILLIGVGGTGSSAVDILYEKIRELNNQTGSHIVALVFDTDAGDVAKIRSATPIPMSDPNLVGSICDDLGVEALREWFPYDDRNICAQEMVKGASQWRKKSFLAFCNLINKQDCRADFHQAMDSLLSNNPGDSYEIYTIASIAGGTGSGSFIPITLYAKRYLKEVLGKSAEATALLACPDIYVESQTEDNKIKVYANAYAILRELNAINLVTHGYNHPKNNNVPIRFSIGNDAMPYVRTLFDSANEAYWAPEAAPFQKIFMLDKIPSLNSVIAHDIVLANSLYTILCTEIGNSFASEISNHAMLLSSSNGYNAIYAGIATAELTYPKESILDYVAHKKTEAACASEWLKLYWDTEERINEEKERAREKHASYHLSTSDYAEKFIASKNAEMKTPTCNIPDIIRRGTQSNVLVGDKVQVTQYLTVYFKTLCDTIKGKLPSSLATENTLKKNRSIAPFARFSKQSKADWRALLPQRAALYHSEISSYFESCLKEIRDNTSNIADSILTLNIRKSNPCANEKMSAVYNLLTREGSYIHPVTAMVQLCELRTKIAELLKKPLSSEITAVLASDSTTLPTSWIRDDENIADDKNFDKRKNYYMSLEPNEESGGRFAQILDPEIAEGYKNSLSNPNIDCDKLLADALNTLQEITSDMKKLFLYNVLSIVSKRLDILIDQYRTFFSRFDKAREDLKESTKEALRMSSGTIGSVINIASDETAKNKAYRDLAESGVESEDDVKENDHIAGSSVFNLVYEAAQLKNIADKYADEADESDMAKPGSFHNLFKNMIESYKKQIRKSDDYKKMASERTILEIITDSCGMKADPLTVQQAHKRIFTELTSLAIPSLKADNRTADIDIPDAAMITVFLFSTNMAKYLKKNALKLGLSEPDPSASEARQILSCAQQFLNKVGATGARVAIVDDISDHTIYVTRENIDIQPIQVRKFDEMSSTPTYFKNYKTAINNIEKLNTDMWNPHLGFNLHKRGYLPYINPNLEKESGKKLAKALLYAIMEGKFTYLKPLRQTLAFRFTGKDGSAQLIRCSEGQTVSTKNISGLFGWLRPQTKLIEEWASAYDASVKAQCHALPALITDHDIARLESAITTAPYIKLLRENIFKNVSTEKGKALEMSLIEFAYAVKASEETLRDCDDAEMILRVGYETFCKFCQHKISFKKNPEKYAQVYMQQLDKFVEAFVTDTDTLKTGEPLSYAKQIIEWMTNNECFRAIPNENMLDNHDNIIWIGYKIDEKLEKKVKEKLAALPLPTETEDAPEAETEA